MKQLATALVKTKTRLSPRFGRFIIESPRITKLWAGKVDKALLCLVSKIFNCFSNKDLATIGKTKQRGLDEG